MSKAEGWQVLTMVYGAGFVEPLFKLKSSVESHHLSEG